MSALLKYLREVFEEESFFGFAEIDAALAEKTGCNRALVTLQPYPDLKHIYSPIEFLAMFRDLGKEHSEKLNRVKSFLDESQIKYALPPASPPNDGSYLAEFSYKWAAAHAGLGFIGKNDVFVHYKYAQRVRISCLLLDTDIPAFSGQIESRCGDCDACVRACPHSYITGRAWHIDIKRDELVDYLSCSTRSRYGGEGEKYSCAYCAMSCTYSGIGK